MSDVSDDRRHLKQTCMSILVLVLTLINKHRFHISYNFTFKMKDKKGLRQFAKLHDLVEGDCDNC